jgi:AbrB family transcriptional regulator, transcriptional pleiotropic regulator of transition state genes
MRGGSVRATVGITRTLDRLGRVVVPAELRRSLGIRDGDEVAITERDGEVMMRKVTPHCAICASGEGLTDLRDKHLCQECVREIRVD